MTKPLILPDPKNFLENIFAALEELCFYEVSAKLPIDHICYRVETEERYMELKHELDEENELLSETLINGRPIATYRLAKPLVYQNRTIELLELPCPKPGSPYLEGYEHVEFVTGEPLATWMLKYPELPWDTKGLQKNVNADLRLKLLSGLSVKYHEHPLDYVIKYLD